VQLAERLGVAVILIRHLNKQRGVNPLYRGEASIGIIGGARAGYLAAKDPEDPERFVLAQVKSNWGPLMPSLSYRLEVNDAGITRIQWEGKSPFDAKALLSSGGTEDDPPVLAKAKR